MSAEDFKVSPAQRAYLLAFDNWLHTTWKVRRDENYDNAARDLKDACLHEVMQEANVSDVPKDPPRGRPVPGRGWTHCARCGGDLPARVSPGRPRKYCLDCRPSRMKAAA